MIKILHLYYDIMNLYGENGNIRALKKSFERQKVDTRIDFLSINDSFDMNNYDIIYIGSGSEDSQKLILEDIMKRKNEFTDYIENDKYLFLTGNALELFGKHIEDDNNKTECLGIFGFYTGTVKNVIKNASKYRIVGETFSKTNLIKKPVIGFQNRCGEIYDYETPLLITNEGYGNNHNTKEEGFIYKNVYATYNIGPLFIRNPYLTDYFINKILKEKKLKYKEIKNTSGKKAYKEYINNFVKEKQ